jgi:hypothetical protein
MVEEMSMSKINSCDVTDCAYNKHNSCHTPAITVGGIGESCPECDTYLHASQRGGVVDLTGGVGACKVSGCEYNEALECTAGAISVGKHKNHAECMTYDPR